MFSYRNPEEDGDLRLAIFGENLGCLVSITQPNAMAGQFLPNEEFLLLDTSSQAFLQTFQMKKSRSPAAKPCGLPNTWPDDVAIASIARLPAIAAGSFNRFLEVVIYGDIDDSFHDAPFFRFDSKHGASAGSKTRATCTGFHGRPRRVACPCSFNRAAICRRDSPSAL